MPKSTTARAGSYQKGEERVIAILNAAVTILVNSGYHNFSLRKVASEAGISVGNLQYYFPSKDALTNALLDQIIEEYIEIFDTMRQQGTPEEQFKSIVNHVMSDLKTKRTTVLFPELWSLANHEKGVTKQVDMMYNRYRSLLVDVIQEINPALSNDQCVRLGVFISSSMEGHTMFTGYRKPWTKETSNLIEIAIQSFLWLIKHGEIPKD